jgi:hypothetical protein
MIITCWVIVVIILLIVFKEFLVNTSDLLGYSTPAPAITAYGSYMVFLLRIAVLTD